MTGPRLPLAHYEAAREAARKEAHYARSPADRAQALMLAEALDVAIAYWSASAVPSGTLVRADVPHICPEPPSILTWERSEEVGWPPSIVDRIPNGSTWSCPECGRVLVVDMSRGQVPHPEWRDETRRERWRRLRAARRACTCSHRTGLPPLHGGYRPRAACPVHPPKQRQAPPIPTVTGKKPL